METPLIGLKVEKSTHLHDHITREIRVLMARNDLRSQAQLAESLGVNPMWVSRRFSHATTYDLDDLWLIASTFGVQVRDLLGMS